MILLLFIYYLMLLDFIILYLSHIESLISITFGIITYTQIIDYHKVLKVLNKIFQEQYPQ